MKKFSKLIQRLGRGRTDINGREDDKESTRESSPDVHQLISRRGVGELKRSPRNGLSRIVVDDEHTPCENCASIDFPRLLNWQPGQPRPWIPLSHTLADSECPYCIFFQAMVGARPDETRKFTPYLRTRQAFERLGIAEKHELGGAVLFEVTTKSKSLPWGYIVRIADGGGDDMAGYAAATTRTSITAAPTLRGRLVAPKLDLKLPRMWLDFCKKNHLATCCRSPGPAIRGLKLVDCEVEDVVSVEDINVEGFEYLTLSYVSGETEKEAEKSDGGLPEVLPPLIADALSVTKSLGYRYLWIDRYCVPRTDEVEKRRQLELMGDIFSRSALTLVVAGGGSISDGIPGVSVMRDEQPSLQVGSDVFTTSLVRPDVEVGNSKWASRGWTFQEGLLSRRRLVFTPSQIYFQCQSLHCHESISFPLQTSPAPSLGRIFPASGSSYQPGYLQTLMNGFISRDFTFFQDRLDAFRGVLCKFAQMETPLENFLGLPLYHTKEFKDATTLLSKTDRLAVGLGWRPDIMSDNRNYVHPLYLEGDTFPSWTWLAWKARRDHGAIAFSFYQTGTQSPVVDGVTAAPGLDVSVGFRDGSVEPWETQSETISAKAEEVAFLRLKTYCFTLRVRREEEGNAVMMAPEMSRVYRTNLVSTLRRAMVGKLDTDPPVGEYELVGVLIASQKSTKATTQCVNVLICGRRNWEPDGDLIRLDTLELRYEALGTSTLTTTDSSNNKKQPQSQQQQQATPETSLPGTKKDMKQASMLKGVITGAFEKEVDINVEMRQVDIH